jgi:ABC-2 type transport system ATP-binding protein
VLLTTQYLEEADQLAEGIAIIDHGRVIAEGTTAQLKASVGTGRVHVRVEDAADRAHAVQVLERTLGVECQLGPDVTEVSAPVTATEQVGTAVAELGRAGIVVLELSLGQPSLDEVFLVLTGHGAEDSPITEEIP